MRMSELFGQTLRETSAAHEAAGQSLLIRSGFIRQLASGIYTYLPLARRSLTKIENILREEIEAIGGQEMTMPVVNPADIWKETGRWYNIGPEMTKFRDRNSRDLVLAMTHEEVVADLIGLPLRVTIGARSLKQGGVELKRRTEQESKSIPMENVAERVAYELGKLQEEAVEYARSK